MNKDLNTLSSIEDKDFFHTYKRLKIAIERGEGCFLYTDKGDQILDMFGGLAVNVLGYNHKLLYKEGFWCESPFLKKMLEGQNICCLFPG